jgi:adenylate cyclase
MELLTLSVGYADLCGFGRAARTLDSGGVVDVLQDAYTIAGDAIIAHGGQIRKYIGDSVLFTCIRPTDAVQAAHEIAAWRRDVGATTLRFRVGLATGEVAVAEVGHRSHRATDIFGETVNQAVTLSDEAGTCESGVAMCDTTRASLIGQPDQT